MMQPVMSNLARKFEFLQDRAQRRPIREAAMDMPGDTAKKTDIGHLKEFYLQRLAKTEPNAAAVRLGAKASHDPSDMAQPQASGQTLVRPTFKLGAPKDIEDLEIMCNNCFNLIKSSEASSCTGDPRECPVACRNGPSDLSEKPTGTIALIDLKLKKLRSALEARLQDSSSKVNVMRHLTQLRYHIDTAMKWIPGCSEIGALSDHTVQQVKQLTATSRVLAPAVYIFSKRIENVVVQKERELRKAMVQTSPSSKVLGGMDVTLDIERDPCSASVADVSSIVSELDSDCGTQYAETLVTQDGQSTDVGNVQDANDYLSLKNEDEQRRWFYSQCLTVKLSCPDKTRARKTLISDLYAKVKEEGIPIEGWVQWIHKQLMPEEAPLAAAEPAKPVPGVTAGSRLAGRGELERTMPVPGASRPEEPRHTSFGSSSMLNETHPVRTLQRPGMQATAFAPSARPMTQMSQSATRPQTTYMRRP
mmetsp:Transcript_65116/g.167633  ORF Transcript_65116/g.167633 Transcript_65116/m.167633 type:complete len:476 (-) Transcript_65116:75-1502(-)|eukprot:CAMPEP_0195098718 /NCGR_PEP_ID=MMETSP0448-20130528/57837_1 /TAXON_ID=66468 /ORGANISM="Heterocapsa triquestra, Strain CCMP 448" /LENGTH=475 /DNA_ID=CAMNT_0040133471 /DNA_START=88 /DNA_END=1515 /DNA_ORIENTATION=+